MDRQSPFEGQLIRLRAREQEDEPLSYEWFNDPEVTEFLTLRYPLSHKNQREFMDAHSAPGYRGASFAITTRNALGPRGQSASDAGPRVCWSPFGRRSRYAS